MLWFDKFFFFLKIYSYAARRDIRLSRGRGAGENSSENDKLALQMRHAKPLPFFFLRSFLFFFLPCLEDGPPSLRKKFVVVEDFFRGPWLANLPLVELLIKCEIARNVYVVPQEFSFQNTMKSALFTSFVIEYPRKLQKIRLIFIY